MKKNKKWRSKRLRLRDVTLARWSSRSYFTIRQPDVYCTGRACIVRTCIVRTCIVRTCIVRTCIVRTCIVWTCIGRIIWKEIRTELVFRASWDMRLKLGKQWRSRIWEVQRGLSERWWEGCVRCRWRIDGQVWNLHPFGYSWCGHHSTNIVGNHSSKMEGHSSNGQTDWVQVGKLRQAEWVSSSSTT